ncbi:MAG TPA: RNA polymerase sigma factor [Saprospiraceae bacterium]|nr:RNA polymerase sigma factor [Saprospiraceae bacterium]
MKTATEKQLIRACRRGHARAQQELYQRYVQAMYHVALRLVGERTRAEDVVQEAFIRVFRQLDQFRGEATIGAWIKRITVNTALNELRRTKKMQFTNLEGMEQLAAPTQHSNPAAFSVREIHESIQELPEGSRVILSLYLLEGYQHKEISKILDISVSTSKSQYHRAKKILQEILAKNKQGTHVR